MVRLADPNRRADILHAARLVFQKRGYAEARMAGIARKAGIASGTLYLYFDSKEAMARALCEDYVGRLTEKLLPALADPDPAAAIADSVHTALAFAADERDLLRLLGLNAGLGKQGRALAADRKLHQLLAQALAERMDRGQIRRYDPQVLAELIAGLIEWVSKACLLNGEGDIARYEATLIRMLQSALLAPEAANPPAGPVKRKTKGGKQTHG